MDVHAVYMKGSIGDLLLLEACVVYFYLKSSNGFPVISFQMSEGGALRRGVGDRQTVLSVRRVGVNPPLANTDSSSLLRGALKLNESENSMRVYK